MSAKLTIKKGMRFGRLIVVREAERYVSKHGVSRRRFECVCDCGVKSVSHLSSLMFGSTRSCGCLIRAKIINRNTIHGGCGTSEYRSWLEMNHRCHNKKASNYCDYGGRGIQVEDSWRRSFVAFLNDMGRKPSPKHSIDRVDNNGGYNKENCRWSTKREQANNKRNNLNITVGSETKTLAQWTRFKCYTGNLIGDRLRRGWSPNDAVNVEPFGKRRLK